MKCPKCEEENNLYFDGGFFKCYTCGLLEWVKDYEELRARWCVGGIASPQSCRGE